MAIQPTRKDKDKAFQRRCNLEEQRHQDKSLPDPPDDLSIQVMNFGEYTNRPIADVPDERLLYFTKWKWCPVYVGYELVQRGYQRAKLPLRFRQRMKADMKANGKWECKPPKFSGTVNVGENYEWLHQAWLDAGGDESICPFGDDYSGPTIQCDDDGPCIYSPVVS